ncbi:hypothetical protein TNCV_2833571 [Trichonephila clavipes]|nr:hypothetical protein TNCV_2833571 [Trichonephila clavipes]
MSCNVHLEIPTEKKHQRGASTEDIINLRNQFYLYKKKRSCLPSISEEAVERARHSFVRNPRESTRVAVCEFGMFQKTIRKVLWKIKFQAVSFALETTNNRRRQVSICAALRTIDRVVIPPLPGLEVSSLPHPSDLSL